MYKRINLVKDNKYECIKYLQFFNSYKKYLKENIKDNYKH